MLHYRYTEPRAWLVGVGAFTALLLITSCRTSRDRPASVATYSQVEIGMTVDEVEAILGRGKEIPRSEVPLLGGPMRPAVEGTSFYRWKDEANAMTPEIVLGFENGKVCNKWYWEPSL
jgi:hypothetical protein